MNSESCNTSHAVYIIKYQVNQISCKEKKEILCMIVEAKRKSEKILGAGMPRAYLGASLFWGRQEPMRHIRDQVRGLK
jgi:hypothetical protein